MKGCKEEQKTAVCENKLKQKKVELVSIESFHWTRWIVDTCPHLKTSFRLSFQNIFFQICKQITKLGVPTNVASTL